MPRKWVPNFLPCWGASPGLSTGGDGLGGLLGRGTCWALLLSSEPGYYRDGEFGIRIEDIALVVEAQTKVTLSLLTQLPEEPGAASSPQTNLPSQGSASGWGAQGWARGLGHSAGVAGDEVARAPPLLPSLDRQCRGGCARQGVGGTHLTAFPQQHPTGEEPFLTFEVVSLVPYDRNLIDVSLLSQEQVQGAGSG